MAAPGSTLPALTLPATVTLRDGRQVTLRPIEEQDEAGVRAAFHRLSADSRYTRFMTATRDLPEALLAAATHPDPQRDFTLLAVSTEGGSETIVGATRYVRVPGTDTCEFAVTVADDWHALGLARRLLAALVEAAKEHGFRCMEGYVLAINTAMRRLAKALGFADTPCPGDATVRLVRLGLAGGGCGDAGAGAG